MSDGPRRPGAQAVTSPTRCWVITGAREVVRLDTCSDVRADVPARREAQSTPAPSALEEVIEYGWPLGDGTAVLAAGGVLARVSLADGRVVESAADAFPPRLAHCHAVPLERPAFGFVCGEDGGMTALFRFDAARRRLVAVRSFTSPRSVETSAAGAWLVHGSCDAGPVVGVAAYCVGVAGPSGYAWREARVDDAPPAAVGLTLDGRLLRVMWNGKQDDARTLTTDASGATQTTRIRVDDTSEGFHRFLSRGVWIGSVEERAPGVVNGWMHADGSVIGVEVDADGVLHHGQIVRELGSFFVAGRYGLGWGRSHRGFETTDGGMTWSPFSAPAPLGPSTVRACGPVGCVANGWLRVGWGERVPEPSARPAPTPRMHGSSAERLTLRCTAMEPLPRPSPTAIQLQSFGVLHSIEPEVDEERELWPAPPGVTRRDALVHGDIPAPLGASGLGSIARLYTWGPAAGEWTGLGRWRAAWRSPFASSHASVSSAIAPAPFSDAGAARAELGMGRPFNWRLAVAEDPAHALLLAGRSPKARELVALDAGGSPVPVRRVDGEPWGTVDAAIRIRGAWYLAVQDGGHVVDIFRADSQGARVVARVVRHLATETVRLARGIDADHLGVVIDGEPIVDRAARYRWVVPVDLESGRVLPPEPLGAADLTDRHAVAPCVDVGGAGWVLETPWDNANVVVDLGADVSATLNRVFVRLRISSERACVEALTGGTSFGLLARAPTQHERTDVDATIPVVAFDERPVDLRCRRQND